MSLTLILIRHAKSGWDDAALDDHKRTLTDRGRRDARRIGTWLAAQRCIPDLILSSDATRTGQTVTGILETLGQSTPVKFTPALYHAGPATLLAQIAQQTASTLALCAHNPGIGELAARLVTTAPMHPRFQDYPTAATTLIRFDAAHWRDIRKGTCVDFTIPRDLNG